MAYFRSPYFVKFFLALDVTMIGPDENVFLSGDGGI